MLPFTQFIFFYTTLHKISRWIYKSIQRLVCFEAGNKAIIIKRIILYGIQVLSFYTLIRRGISICFVHILVYGFFLYLVFAFT